MSRPQARYRVGIAVGGTFTDFLLNDALSRGERQGEAGAPLERNIP